MAYNYYVEEYAKEDLSKCIVEPKIELTLEEAKKISDALEWVDGYMYSYAYGKDIETFKKRIKQIEMSIAST